MSASRACVLLAIAAAACHGGSGTPSPLPSDAVLADLVVSPGTLTPSFAPAIANYASTTEFVQASITVMPTVATTGAIASVNGTPVPSGQTSAPLALAEGDNLVVVQVRGPSGALRDYEIVVRRGTVGEFAQQAYAKASNTGIGDAFGHAVAISGDTLVVGAPLEDSSSVGVGGIENDDGAADSGAVYVFVRSGAAWVQQAYLKASNTDPGDRFGAAVAIDGDTIAVGAPLEDSSAVGIDGDDTDNGAADSGAVFVFARSGSTWTQQAYIKASNTGAGDRFGIAVALAGDTLAVGADGEDSSAAGVGGDETDNAAPDSGAVYVFTVGAGVWLQQAYVKASNTEANDGFGAAVAIAGDTLAVGAPGEDSNAIGIDGDGADNSATDSGAAYVFVRTALTWSQQAYVKASNTGAADAFGGAVAVAGDTLAVGAPGEDSAATGIGGNEADNTAIDSGAVYVFGRSGTAWSQQAYAKATNTDAGDRFGACLALAGDLLAVGTAGEDSGASGINGDAGSNTAANSGAIHVFARAGSAWSQLVYGKASNTGAGDAFGASVAVSGTTIVTGAPGEDSAATGVGGNEGSNAAPSSGACYVFR